MTKRRTDDYTEGCATGFLPPLTELSCNIPHGREIHWHCRGSRTILLVISERHNTSLREGWLIAVGHGPVAFLRATLHLLAQASAAGCSQHQVGQLARLRWEKYAPFNTAEWLPVPAVEAALKCESHYCKVNSTQSIFFFYLSFIHCSLLFFHLHWVLHCIFPYFK